MKLRHLESALDSVDVFEDPKIHLEQIPTSAHLASRMIHTAAETYGDIDERFVGDFGVGTGMLSIASRLMGAYHVVGVDVDQEALDTAWSDVQSISFSWDFDTVVMNPPFGTRNTGIDTLFMCKAMESSSVVYSLHKTSTRPHFLKLAERNGWTLEVLAEMRYDIPRTHKFHKQKSKDIEVDLYRVSHV